MKCGERMGCHAGRTLRHTARAGLSRRSNALLMTSHLSC
ncbi:hypothetical protein D187_007235 [Cystobacter fuscus DSM 2262]|uniref:Uncharacterized protein n=1 Tax=Cystobacter fuscus (strain ATCC 25194 / DSM 2262 / NBRC 100088 / M29) TaxID=1242864 RepID=S9P0Z9_CYSF2|nr:hypothetical protein D187_007235 [Cystobacter fuscus DSM 2262]